MASRSKDSKSGPTSMKTPQAPRERTTRASRVTEEAQAMGADVVPSVTIEVDAPRHHIAANAPAWTTDSTATGHSLLSDWDYHLFNEGSHTRLWEKLGAHVVS